MIASHGHGAVSEVRLGELTLGLKRFAPHARVERHRHETAYCCVLLRGLVEERAATTRRLEPGALTIRTPGAAHSLRFDKTAAVAVIIEIGIDRYVRLESEGFVRPFGEVKSAAVNAAAVRLAREFPARDGAARLVMEGVALELLGMAAGASHWDGRAVAPTWLRRARERVMDDAWGGYSVKTLAAEVGVHASHLAAAFRAWYGESPGDLLRRRRLDRAADLLRTHLPLTEVALSAGYYDQSHFTNDFRARTGMTPREFREAIRT